jgi:hypothetical protein
LCRGGYSLLIVVVQVISSTSLGVWWFALLWMVFDGPVASWRLV